MSDEQPLDVEQAAARAGVSVDTIRRAYRAGRLRAYRPAGQRKVVIRREDLDAWAFSDETLVAPTGPLPRLRAAAGPERRRAAPRTERRPAETGSVARLLELERRG